MKHLDWIVYWIGDIPTATWVSRKEAQALVNNKEVEVSRWIRA